MTEAIYKINIYCGARLPGHTKTDDLFSVINIQMSQKLTISPRIYTFGDFLFKFIKSLIIMC